MTFPDRAIQPPENPDKTATKSPVNTHRALSIDFRSRYGIIITTEVGDELHTVQPQPKGKPRRRLRHPGDIGGNRTGLGDNIRRGVCLRV